MTATQVDRLGRGIHGGAVWLFSVEVVVFVACAVGFAWLFYLALVA
jgi:hypothetical protein